MRDAVNMTDSDTIVGITNTATSITAAGLTLGATWYHTYTVKKLARVAGQEATLATLLLRDGKQMLALMFTITDLYIFEQEPSTLGNENDIQYGVIY